MEQSRPQAPALAPPLDARDQQLRDLRRAIAALKASHSKLLKRVQQLEHQVAHHIAEF